VVDLDVGGVGYRWLGLKREQPKSTIADAIIHLGLAARKVIMTRFVELEGHPQSIHI